MGAAAEVLAKHDAAHKLAVKNEMRRRARLDLARRARENPVQYNAAVRLVLIRTLHDRQRSVVADIDAGNRYLSLCCSRRAGKTYLLAILIVLFLLDAAFGEEVVFVAPTMKRGKELIWDEVERLIDEFCLPWRPTANIGTVRTLTGARFRIVGLDKKKQIGKVARGGNTRAFLADECQEFAHLLRDFIAAASPALAQTRGIFIAAGTPGVAESGYWHGICHGKEGFTPRNWTLFDNPYLPRPADEILREERERMGWAEDHPDYVREWLGRWTRDKNRLVFEYDPLRNLVDIPPDYDVRTWKHFIGVDYGLVDPCAWVVLAAHPNSRDVYCVHAHKLDGLTSDEIARETQALKEWFRPVAIVGDSASGGATFIKDWNVRYGLKVGVRMRHAKKHDKAGSIKTYNTELRKSRLRLVKGGAEDLASELAVLQYADDERTEILEGRAFPDHCADASRYALNEFTAYLHKAAANTNEKTEAELEQERIEARNRAARGEDEEDWGMAG